jgi:hypothetical protein
MRDRDSLSFSHNQNSRYRITADGHFPRFLSLARLFLRPRSLLASACKRRRDCAVGAVVLMKDAVINFLVGWPPLKDVRRVL